MSAVAPLPGRWSPAVRRWSRPGATPLGAILAGFGVVGGVLVELLHLDRLPITLCTFKRVTGLPCMTCGSTRALGALARLDPLTALAVNPAATLAGGLLVVWALADLALLTRHRAVSVDLAPGWTVVVRTAAVVALLVNWAYLLAAGR